MQSVFFCNTHRYIIQLDGKRERANESSILDLTDPCRTVPIQYHCWGMPGRPAGSPVAYMREYNAQEPKTGQQNVQLSWTPKHFAHLGILFIYSKTCRHILRVVVFFALRWRLLYEIFKILHTAIWVVFWKILIFLPYQKATICLKSNMYSTVLAEKNCFPNVHITRKRTRKQNYNDFSIFIFISRD